MTKYTQRFGCLLLLVIALQLPSFAWNDLGHMTVAYVAYQQLKPITRNRVDELLKLNPEHDLWLTLLPVGASDEDKRMMVFMIAATWSDRIKQNSHYTADGTQGGNRPPGDGTASQNIGYPDLAMHKYWHFIDQPFSQDGTVIAPVPTPNVQTQIDAFRSVLASTSPDALKSYDLAWLLHLVGDVHQPLHCVSRFGKTQKAGDNGGNSVKVCNPQCGGKLHAFWDDALGTGKSPTAAIKVGKSLNAAAAKLAATMETAAWVEESFQAAQAKVYQKPIGAGAGPFPITLAYRKNAGALAQKRVALAGARLANLLNSELK